MKIAMDSSVLDIYERMLDPNDRRSNKPPKSHLRYSADDERAFNMIESLEKISKIRVSFCKLPSNQGALNRNTKVNETLPECCEEGLDIELINKRINELNANDNLEDCCKLLAEAEECGVNIILTTNGLFKQNLQPKAKNNIRILHPINDLKEIVT